jgi:hypothetical protein
VQIPADVLDDDAPGREQHRRSEGQGPREAVGSVVHLLLAGVQR